MHRRIALWLSFLILIPVYAPRAADDIVLRAMRDELARSMDKLRLEGLEKPYFIAYRVTERTGTRISASFGSVVNNAENRSRILTVELHVGDYSLDNTNYFSLPSRPAGVARLFGGTIRLPFDDNYDELRRQIWLVTDSVYKQALEDVSRKRAALQNKSRTEEVPDFTREEITSIEDDAAPAAWNAGEAQALVRDLSALFKEMPDVSSSLIQLVVNNTHTRYLNSEGTSFMRRTPSVTLTALAATQATDGMPIEDFVTAYGRSLMDLPAKRELVGSIQELGKRLAQLRQVPQLDRYTGPVLFEGQAAAELFLQAFAPRLLASRRLITDSPQMERFLSQAEDSFADKIGSRVLPEFLNVVDNPTVAEHDGTLLFGGYKADEEGVRARATVLVKNGVLKTLLSTRSPVAGVEHSTGNRRGSRALPANLLVTADKGLSAEEMKDALLRVVKQRGKEYGIVVRRIGNPALKLFRDLFGELGVMPGQQPRAMQEAITAYRVFPDGREELIRNVEVTGVAAPTFKEIVAASRSQMVYTAPFATRDPNPFSSAIFLDPEAFSGGGMVVSSAVPSLLFDEMTLKKPSGEVPKPPVAKHPFFDK